MKPPIALMLVILLASPPRATALDANKAAYVGGTVFSLNASDGPIEGRLDLGSNELVFAADAGPHATAHLRIEHESVRGLELGQRQDRQLPLVVAVTALLGPVGLLSLSAKRRAHYLTVERGRPSGFHCDRRIRSRGLGASDRLAHHAAATQPA